MEKKLRNKEIRRLSNASSLPLLIFTLVTAAGALLLNFLTLSSDYDSPFRSSDVLYTIRWAVVYPLLMPLLYLVFYKMRGKSQNRRLKSVFAKPERSAGWCAKWIIIAVGVSQLMGSLLNSVLNQILLGFGIYPKNEYINPDNDLYWYILSFIVSVIFAPFFEELLFRGNIFRNNEDMGQLFAVIVTGLAFGLWHTNYSQFFSASFAGMFFCFIFIKTRSIIPCMLTHLVNNFLCWLRDVVTPILASPLSSPDLEYRFHAIFVVNPVAAVIYCAVSLAIVLITIAGSVLLIRELIKNRRRLHLAKGSFDIGTAKKTLVYFSAPVTFAAYLLMLALTVISVIQ